jgi:hypothetical protein
MSPAIRPALVALTCAATSLTACSSTTIAGHGSGGPSAPAPAASSPAFPSSTSAPSSTPAPTTTTSSGGSNNSTPSGEALEQATKAAIISATAFRMKGTSTEDSQPVTFDIHYGESSSRGHVTMGGQDVELLNSGPDLYMKASRTFWTQTAGAPDSVVNLLADKWVHLPADSPGLSDLADIAIRERFVEKALASPDTDTYTTGPSKTINGVPAVSFVSNGDTTVYVPAHGTPYPLRIEDHSSSAGSFDLTGWNVPFTADPPPSDQIVELPH